MIRWITGLTGVTVHDFLTANDLCWPQDKPLIYAASLRLDLRGQSAVFGRSSSRVRAILLVAMDAASWAANAGWTPHLRATLLESGTTSNQAAPIGTSPACSTTSTRPYF